MAWVILFCLIAVPAVLFFILFVGIIWTHRPIPLREIIKGLLFGSGKEK